MIDLMTAAAIAVQTVQAMQAAEAAPGANTLVWGGGGAAIGVAVVAILKRVMSFKRVHAEIDLGGNGHHSPDDTKPQPCPLHEGLVDAVQATQRDMSYVRGGMDMLLNHFVPDEAKALKRKDGDTIHVG